MNYRKGFSFIELSIVILIIGILIAGVTEGRRLIYQARITQARALTNSSPVSGIKDLVFWVEPTSKNSFNDSDLRSDSLEINTWHDINPTTLHKLNLKVIPGFDSPTYEKHGIGGLPSVYFNANDSGDEDVLKTDGNEPTEGSSEFSIFIVSEAKQRRATHTAALFARSDGIKGYNIYARIVLDDGDRWSAWTGNTDGNWNKLDKILTYHSSQIVSFHYKNGTQSLSLNGDTPETLTKEYDPNLPGGTTLTLGGHVKDDLSESDFFYNGLISEVIMYNRGLKNSETEAVEEYLSQKYGIPLE